jgi:hypothetical protein
VYATREDVKTALGVAETARANSAIDRALESATDDVDRLLRRRFVPWVGTRWFPWPDPVAAASNGWRIWLGFDELAAMPTAVTAGGVALTLPGDILPEPVNYGPPYDRIELNLGTSASFTAGSTWQRAIAVTGTFCGCALDTVSLGRLADTLEADADGQASVTWSTADFGVGSLLRVDDEYMLVTDRNMVATGETLAAPLAAQSSAASITVADGDAYAVGAILQIDIERMRVVEITGNVLTVDRRNYDGSTLATHSAGAAINILTGVTLLRAQCGTTLAAHNAPATIYRHVIPAKGRDLAIAYAMTQFLGEQAGYARTAGQGDNEREVTGRGVRAVEMAALERYGRQILQGAI